MTPSFSRRRSSWPLALAAAGLLMVPTGLVASRGDLVELRARADALAHAEKTAETRLQHAHGALSTTRARIDALRTRQDAEAEVIAQRLRVIYATPPPDPLTVLLGGDLESARLQNQLLEAANARDAQMLARYRQTRAELAASERELERRTRELAGQQAKFAARRAAARARLEASQRRVRTSRPATPLVSDSRASRAPGVGLDPRIMEERTLPGVAPVDARSGVSVSLTPPRQTGASADASGLATVSGPAEAYRGPRRMVMVTGVYPGRSGVRTAAGVDYNHNAMVAVHRTLPLGTALRLRYGSRTVTARVVDRGPYRSDRDLEVSPGAAAMIGLNTQARIAVEVLED